MTYLTVLLLSSLAVTSAFVPQSLPSSIKTILFGVKRGSLQKNASNADPLDNSGNVRVRKSKRKSSSKSSSKTSSTSKTSAGVSPSLAQWAETTDMTVSGSDGTETKISESEDVETTNTYKPFSKKNKKGKLSDRRSKQAERSAEDEERREIVKKASDELLTVLEDKNRKLEVIFDKLRQIKQSSGDSGMKAVSSAKVKKDFRMVWVGSDEAVCHMGTGLHNVPLARLQEVFMTLGQSQMELLEIIRVIGPFPNVLNTLSGQTSVKNASTFQISYNSMVDGTGKEILAGKEENVKVVALDVVCASEDAIVLSVPNKDEEDVFANNGASLIIFLPEDDLDVQLDILRVR